MTEPDPKVEAERARLEQIASETLVQVSTAQSAKAKAITELVEFESRHGLEDE